MRLPTQVAVKNTASQPKTPYQVSEPPIAPTDRPFMICFFPALGRGSFANIQ